MDQWPQRDKERSRSQNGLALLTLIIITEGNKIGKGKGLAMLGRNPPLFSELILFGSLLY